MRLYTKQGHDKQVVVTESFGRRFMELNAMDGV